MQQLFDFLNAIAALSPALRVHIERILVRKEFKKGEFIVREGQICGYIFFLESGLVRIYNTTSSKEVTTWFLKEGNLFISVDSFFGQWPSLENITAMEDCVCWGISFRQLEEILEKFLEFQKHHGMILRNYYMFSQRRQLRLASQTSLERYTTLEVEESWLLERVPMNILWTYLQLSERTFKRARQRYYLNERK